MDGKEFGVCAKTLERKGNDFKFIEGSLEKGFEAFIQRAMSVREGGLKSR